MLLKNMSPLGGGGERLIVNGICPLGNHSQQGSIPWRGRMVACFEGACAVRYNAKTLTRSLDESQMTRVGDLDGDI